MLRKAAAAPVSAIPSKVSPSAPTLQGSHVRAGRAHCPVFLTAPSISSQPSLSAGSREDWGALHGVRSCQRGKEGAPAPRSMRAGAQPAVYTESAKLTRACKVLDTPSIDPAADRCAAAVGWGRRSEQTLPSVPSAWDGAGEWRGESAAPRESQASAFHATPPGSGT